MSAKKPTNIKEVPKKTIDDAIDEMYYNNDGEKYTWDETHKVSNDIGELILGLTKTIGLIAGRLPVLRDVPDFNVIILESKGVMRDLNSHSKTFKTIRNKHKDKLGVINSIEEFSESMNRGVEYADLNDLIINATVPLANKVSARYNTAEVYLKNKEKENRESE